MKVTEVAALFMFAVSFASQAEEPFDERLKGPDYRTYPERVDFNCKNAPTYAWLLGRLDIYAMAIPNVPPEEAAYLKAELDAHHEMVRPNGPTDESARRYALFTSRRMYASWDARNNLNALKVAIQKTNEKKRDSKAFRTYRSAEMNNVADALDLMYLATTYASSVSEVQRQEFFARDRLISESQNNRLLASTGLTYELAGYAKCELSKLKVH